jgi:AcrR family transcriptional regulator
VSPAAPYHHFRDKNALLAAVAEEGFRRLASAAERARLPSAPVAALEQVLMVYITFATQHPAHFQVMFLPELHAGRYAELDLAAGETFGVLVRKLQQAAAPHGARRHSLEQMAAVTLAVAHGFASLARKDSLWKKASAKGLRGVVRAAAEMLEFAWSG